MIHLLKINCNYRKSLLLKMQIMHGKFQSIYDKKVYVKPKIITILMYYILIYVIFAVMIIWYIILQIKTPA
jgi:hypothetical protein